MKSAEGEREKRRQETREEKKKRRQEKEEKCEGNFSFEKGERNACRYAFFGVFDGTVKEFASDFVSKSILDCLLTSPSFRAFDALPPEVPLIQPKKKSWP